jgi:putative toxin-antitoxin system antitoxin component (TIGR02293 family)
MPELNKAAEPMPPGAFYALMGGKLGVSRIRSDEDLALLVEQRLPATAIRSLVRGGVSDTEVYRLIVPRRTLAHRIARRQPLSRDESDKAVRVARITTMAERAFQDAGKAWRWLRKPKRRFEGKGPMEKLATETGARLVEETILQLRIRHDGVTLWRITGHRGLDGAGGLLAPGRWHTQGSRIAYCAPNPATALVEVLVHVEIDAGDLPDRSSTLRSSLPTRFRHRPSMLRLSTGTGSRTKWRPGAPVTSGCVREARPSCGFPR